MTDTRVLHTADTHLGYQQYHLPQRRQDFLDAFRRVAADAVQEEVDAVVHAGDLFHDRRPTLPDIMGALSVLRDLDAAGIPFLAVVGNHEAKRDAQWLDLFESLGLATRLGPEPVTVGEGGGAVALYGLDFVPRARRADLAYEFDPADAAHAALVTHGLFEPFEHGDWDARELLEASPVRFDALLLGDDHTPATRRLDDPHDAWLTYPGSTERTSADQRESRGYNLVLFGGGGAEGVDVRHRTLETRPFVYVDVDLGDGEGVGRVRERVTEHDLTDAVAVVTITGEGDPVAPAAVEEAAEQAGALTARVTDRRELTERAETEVSFADPDEAVRERVQDLGLSPVAREVDRTVRAGEVPDSRVTEAVERRVREATEAADDGARFDPADGSGGADERTGHPEQDEKRGQGQEGEREGSDEPEQGRSQEDAEDRDRDRSQEGADDQVTMEDYL